MLNDRPLWKWRAVSLAVAALLALAMAVWGPPSPPARAAGPCDPPVVNPVACENTRPGTPESEWQIDGVGNEALQGFTTDISVNTGGTVHFKIKTSVTSYTVKIYRLGWYGGDGAREIASFTRTGPHNQPACLFDASTNLTDCGNWSESATWAVPSNAVSGVYFARLIPGNNSGDSHIVFVVRDDSSHSDAVFQTSDTTWQAYNSYGGASLYPGPIGRAYKVSYNRPFDTRGSTPWGRDFVFANEYPMIRFLERNGYDLTYLTGVDVARSGGLLLNHDVFLSVGHDEYWSGEQRAHVTAARDAGVDLAFFSGNEVYWKTRWENSVDGANTPWRTMVTYKETYGDVDDPQGATTWTGTWRDPRESPPADGGHPENGLTGVGYMVNDVDMAITVPAADGRMRLWRGTDVATLGAGQVATLSPHTLGYESDEDLLNAARPAGLVRLSTTTGPVTQYLQDYGTTVAPGTTTHHLTLYRAPSGALVFGAGTIQWSWGLDDRHDGAATPVDQRMQQATVNLFADMGIQPASLQPGLAAATASTDTTPPSVTIGAPAAGATVSNGGEVTVSGTASDAGGQVGAVEVSLDGGTTWRPATGRGTWSYTGVMHGLGASSIKVRAADDSANLSTPVSRSVTVACPCLLFGSSMTPKVPAFTDATPIEVGVRFTADVGGWVTGIRFYKGTGNTGSHTGSLWTTTSTQLATATFTNETASGWQEVAFAQPVQITANTTYIASYFAPNGHFSGDTGYFETAGLEAAPLRSPRHTASAANGVFRSGSAGFPSDTYGASNYWVEPVFSDVEPPDVTAPAVTAQAPIAGATSVPTTVAVTAVFSEAVQPATIGFTLAAGGSNVAGSVGYDAATRTATFTPSTPLANATAHTATVSGARDAAGNTLAAPVGWTFTTAAAAPPPGTCPCSVWPDSAVPRTVTENDPAAVELGMKFRSDQDGHVTGIRFYKGPQNTGAHTGTLWSAEGTQLATGTFTNESAAGWQTLTFTSPVPINKNTTYVASYHTTTGRYSVNANGFGGVGVDSPPLHALANGVDGQNGVYVYGGHAFPTNGTPHNYWVDVVMTLPPDTTAPTLSARSPGTGATSVPVNAAARATFSEAVTPASVTMTLTDAQNQPVAAQPGYDASTRVATLTPTAPLASGGVYTVAVSGAQDQAGNTMTPVSWSFTASGVCPCTLFESTATPGIVDAGDSGSVELGVRFTAAVDGWISGVRFYKSAANTGTHTGKLWTANGTQLATATFTNETASGWQQVNFGSPIPVVAGTTYVASYRAPNGHYSADGYAFDNAVSNAPLTALAGGNGVYSYTSGAFPNESYHNANYWVDVVFTTIPPPDTTPPAVTAVSPLSGATSVAHSATPQVTFSEAVAPATVAMTVSSAAGQAGGTVSYDAPTRTATFTPTGPLAPLTQYTVTVSGAADAANNVMAQTNWSFTTAWASSPDGLYSLWSDTTTPGTVDAGDPGAVELGVKFTASVNGQIAGIRFYKSAANTGSHVGTLWDGSGTPLASATFTNESTTGWQEVLFATPVQVTAGTTYVASYHTNTGHYSVSSSYFSTNITNGPLTALASGGSGGNGVYAYGASSTFPTGTYNAANYWVDVVFSPAS
ncbi:DUF4082 domain-containing protein [Frankia nepalensis]|uniref:DUF4082 domain-containing protein n=1 Tax=Frankia nepalensis TaxID=1836974 RepID=UPI001931C17B|nr:DUF4082 domain-containing protein [Frankia nepalensis]